MSDDIKKLIEAQGRAIEEERKANDQRLKALEERGHVPADLEEKLKKISDDATAQFKSLQAAIAEAQRPTNGIEGKEVSKDVMEYRSALASYMRTGKKRADLDELQKKALSGLSDPDGGYLLDSVLDSEVDRVADTQTSFANVAGSVVIGERSYKKLVKTRGVSGGWMGLEEEAPGETDAPQWSEIEIIPQTVYAEPHAPSDLMEDAQYNLESDLIEEAGVTFGLLEGDAFLNGDGIKKPRGLLTHTTVANASYAWGSVGYIASGADGAFAASNPADNIIDLQHSLKQQYRNGAVMLMADATLAEIRQMKDGAGNFYLFNPNPAEGFAGQVLGAPVAIDDYMPAIASDAYAIAYGNFNRAYKIVRRRGVALLRDPYTKKGHYKFFFTRRTGGDVINFEAFKVMKFAAT
jgi:HK97 family phage major capsid protein